MNQIDLDALVYQIELHGPTRVMIGPDEAIGASRAEREREITPTVIFVRNDGWSLGAPREWEADAEKLYRDAWIAVLRPVATDGVTFWQATPYGRAHA